MLHLGRTGREPFALPDAFVTETIAILAKRGAGKTYLMRKLFEQMVKAGLPVALIDPVGVCWGLRASANGKSSGLPVVICGGAHGDLPLEAESGGVLADWLIAERHPVVFDLSSLPSKTAERRFVADFAERIYRRNRDPLHIMLDEADAFAPQSPQQGDKRMLGAINTLTRRGRARGIGVTLATQRSAVLNKDVLTQAEVLVAMRMTAPHDRKAIEAWIEYHGTKDDRQAVLRTLGDLPVGTAWFWSPGSLDGLSKVRVGKCETFDSSATPKPGKPVVRPKLGPIDLGALNERIQATIERAKASDPRELAADLSRERATTKRLEAEIERLKSERVPSLSVQHRSAISLSADQLDRVAIALRTVLEETTCQLFGRQAAPPAATLTAQEAAVWLREHQPPTPTPKTPTPPSPPASGLRPLKPSQRKLLTALAQHGPMTPRRLAAMTGYKAGAGGFNNLLSILRGAAEIFPGRPLKVSPIGLRRLGPFEPLPTGEALLQMWLGKLDNKAARECLKHLWSRYPKTVSRKDLAAATGYSPTGGGFGNGLSKLRTLGLLALDNGEYRAHPNLF